MKVEKSNREITADNYFDVGSADDLVVSSSSLQYIDPNQGGSILRYRDYMSNNTEKKQSRSLERGKAVHWFLKNPDDFGTLPVLPGEKMAVLVDRVHAVLMDKGSLIENIEDYPQVILEQAQEIGFGGKNWKADTIINKVRNEGSEYFNALKENQGKILLSPEDHLKVQSVVSTIESSEERKYIIDLPEVDNEETFLAREFPIGFTIDGIECKALLDHLYIDHKKKLVILRDLKTTGKPVSKFMGFLGHFPDDNLLLPVVKASPGAFQTYRIYRQLAFYGLAIQSVLPNRGAEYTVIYKIDAVETIEPFEMITYSINPKWIYAGVAEIEECMKLIKRYKNHYKLDVF